MKAITFSVGLYRDVNWSGHSAMLGQTWSHVLYIYVLYLL